MGLFRLGDGALDEAVQCREDAGLDKMAWFDVRLMKQEIGPCCVYQHQYLFGWVISDKLSSRY